MRVPMKYNGFQPLRNSVMVKLKIITPISRHQLLKQPHLSIDNDVLSLNLYPNPVESY
jgi:hypothetical protein